MAAVMGPACFDLTVLDAKDEPLCCGDLSHGVLCECSYEPGPTSGLHGDSVYWLAPVALPRCGVCETNR